MLSGLVRVIVLVAAAVGVLFITRGTAVHRVRGVGADGRPVAPAEPSISLSVGVLTGLVIVPGNRVELALNGDGTFPRLWTDLRGAQRSITIQNYYAEPGRVADTLGAILEERARAGVAVYLLYDAFGSNLPDAYLNRLRSAGCMRLPSAPCGSRTCGWSRTARTCAASWWIAEWAGLVASVLTNGSAMAGVPANGGKPMFVSRAPRFGQRMETVFFDDLGYSLEIELEAFQQRPWYRRVAEWTANLITPLL